MAELILCSAAEVDYTESLYWYAERSVEAASDFDEELHFALNEIKNAPERFPLCDSRHRFFLIRRFPFRIIYRIIHADIVVIAIAHASRAPDYWVNR